MDIEKIQEFENTIEGAKLKALSKVSLKRPLTDKEFEELMKLKDKLDELL